MDQKVLPFAWPKIFSKKADLSILTSHGHVPVINHPQSHSLALTRKSTQTRTFPIPWQTLEKNWLHLNIKTLLFGSSSYSSYRDTALMLTMNLGGFPSRFRSARYIFVAANSPLSQFKM